jgi:glucose/arabinose dehydrogenase
MGQDSGPLSRRRFLLTLGAGAAGLSGCFSIRPPNGGAIAPFYHRCRIDASDIGAPPGYRIEPVADGLTYPTGVILDDAGCVHVVEGGYSYGEDFRNPRLLRLECDGERTVIAVGERNGPWSSGCFHQGAFYVAEGGELQGGRILRITPDGAISPLIEHLASLGDHHTNRVRIGPDGWLYFGIGMATNSAVVGLDNYRLGWLRRHPEFHDTPPCDIVLTGENFETGNPLTRRWFDKAVTGAYVPFGTPTAAGQVIPGRVPANGAIFRLPPQGGEPALVAWGFRNPFAISFTPDGQLYAVDDDPDVRGSRPLFGTGSQLWCVQPGLWYGWPDYWAGVPVTDSRFKPPHKPQPKFLLAEHPNVPPEPAALLAVHSCASGLDFSFNPDFGHVGEAFIALFGDISPATGRVLHPVGFRVVRVNPRNGVIEDFLINKGKRFGPASKIGGGGLERPVDVRFNRDGSALYVTDFGVLTIGLGGLKPHPGTGVLWRVTRC